MTIDKINQQLAICKAATPGPWDVEERPPAERKSLSDEAWAQHFWINTHWGPCVDSEFVDLDLAFIAAARTGWPAALKELAEAKARLLQAEEYLQAVWEDPPIALHSAVVGWTNDVRSFLRIP